MDKGKELWMNGCGNQHILANDDVSFFTFSKDICTIIQLFKGHLNQSIFIPRNNPSGFSNQRRLSSSNIFLLNTTCFGSCPVHVWYPTILLWYPTIVFFFNLLFISLMYLWVSFPSTVIFERWKYGTKNDKYEVCICTEHMVYGDINVSHPMY